MSKRRSTGQLRRSSQYSCYSSTKTIRTVASQMSLNSRGKEIWRAPGVCEIPDILGKAFLRPELPTASETTLTLREPNAAKCISRRPWLPPNPHADIPALPPLVRSENEFQRAIRKSLPKVRVPTVTNPKAMYTNFSEIGTGVNGSVLKATHCQKRSLRVAIKRCRLDPDKEYRAAILRELRIMSSGHANLIRLREAFVWRDDVWMTMDLMKCSVFAVLCQRGIPEDFTVYIAGETLKALYYLHSKGYIHRDIKCENLLIGWNGEVKLADFGLATRSNRRNCDRLGTAKWMAPEVIREQYYDETIDMWSLGITIIEMMDRVPPHYRIKDEYELFETVLTEPSPTFTYSYPSMYMRGLVAWLLDEDPRTRPSARDVILEIDAHIQSNLLRTSTPDQFTNFLYQVLP
ncbi:hypothetical protein K450DRAFT_219635 [Umbelopsis ramanniana AG]|uniref:non-specific serine/threonine protein kinase n=1 Tax=Umbelopsis ramanniana AG TaxID=1314678 RepID=A0AAD5EJM8_UMBRA|nr:uncharacterized protein K450DRAFT_219635 [Umbelopsis ramanniana AG]KAI8584390.1 hypothetical protein K450DRAFT_219635 [Umbelopsis ramanniana AG]